MHFEPIETSEWSTGLNRFPDRIVFQTPAWLSFLEATQKGRPIIAALQEGGGTLGYFAGLMVRRWGVKILGSPFPGWSTPYMGLNLLPGVSRAEALEALVRFAFRDLGCCHFEMVDLGLTAEEACQSRCDVQMNPSLVVDLAPSEEELFANMQRSCRTNIRKAESRGVVVEEAEGLDFADEFYEQLQDVFARQSWVPTYGVERVREMIRRVYPTGMLLLLRARDATGRSVATCICPVLNQSLFVLGLASWRQYQHLRPNEALHWYAMRWAKRHGVRLYNMVGNRAFKRKFGGFEVHTPLVRRSSNVLISQARRWAPAAARCYLRLAWEARRAARIYLSGRRGSQAPVGSRQPVPAPGSTRLMPAVSAVGSGLGATPGNGPHTDGARQPV